MAQDPKKVMEQFARKLVDRLLSTLKPLIEEPKAQDIAYAKVIVQYFLFRYEPGWNFPGIATLAKGIRAIKMWQSGYYKKVIRLLSIIIASVRKLSVDDLVEFIKKLVIVLFEVAWDLVDFAFQLLLALIQQLLETLLKALTDLINEVPKKVLELLKPLLDALNEVMKTLGGLVGTIDGIAKVVGNVEDMLKPIKDSLKAIKNVLDQIMKAIPH